MTRFYTLIRDDNCPNYGKALHIGAGLTVASVNGCPTISVDETANLGLVANRALFGNATGGITQDADFTFNGVTNQLGLGLGTTVAPSYTFNGDLDTGMFSPAANFVALTAGGNTGVQVSASDVTLTGAVRINNFLAFVGASQNLTTTGTTSAVNVLTTNTDITLTTAADLATLAAGSQDGQLKIITVVAEGAVGNGLVLTPVTPLGFTTITFTAAGTNIGDTVMLEYKNATWRILSVRGNIVVA